MRRSGIPLALLAAVASLALASASTRLAAAADTEPDAMLADVGAKMFLQYCASCHGTDAKGDGPVAAALKAHPADLTHIAARHQGRFPDAEIAREIDGRFDVTAHGTREMPVWGRRFGESIAEGTEPDEVVRGRLMALVEYLKTIQKP
jgi:mono/diheme cytochrome c family protein